MDEPVICDLCGRSIPPHAHYIVRIDVFADPAMPPVTSEELAELNLEEEMRKLLDQMKHLTADDLQDQVHRRFEYRICRACQFRFLANPLGKPRQRDVGHN
jgi:hypothetical protein